MYKTVGESVDTALALKPLVANANHCEVVIAPVFTALKTSPIGWKARTFSVAARTVRPKSKKAHTPAKSLLHDA